MIEETYEGVPRNKIPWAPKIDYDKCITCGKCVDYCHNRVFEIEENNGKKKTIVKHPNACVVFCRGCEDVCPVGAITHPSEEETQKIIGELKKDQKHNIVHSPFVLCYQSLSIRDVSVDKLNQPMM